MKAFFTQRGFFFMIDTYLRQVKETIEMLKFRRKSRRKNIDNLFIGLI